MTTAKKGNNGNLGSETVVDLAHEAKVAVDALMEVANLTSENSRSLLDAQAKFMNTALELGQQYSKVYGDLFLTATQQYFDQAMAFRGAMSTIFEANYKKLSALTASEQSLALEAAEAYQAQAKVATERVADLFTPIVK